MERQDWEVSGVCRPPPVTLHFSWDRNEMQNQYGMNILNRVQCQSAGWTPTPGHVKGGAEPKVFLGADLHRQID